MRIKAILSLCLFTLATAVSADEFIKINTDQVGLVLRAADNGRLYQSYLGKRLANESDLQHLPKGNEAYLTHGMEDYFEPAIEVHHNDANPSSLLKYVSHTSKNVQPGVDETVITLQDDKYPVTVKLHYVAYAKENIIKTFTEISHQEKKPLKLERYASAMLHFSRPAYYLTEFSGDWIYEATMSTTPLNFGKKVLDTKLGARANMFTPPMFILSLDKESSENEGEVILGTLGWTGNFRFTFEVDNKKDLRVIAGINADAAIHGCLLFRPLPKQFDDRTIRAALSPEKDIDGITDGSLAGVFTNTAVGYPPCTAQACLEILKFYNIPLSGRRAVVVGRSLVVGKPAAMMLDRENATVTLCNSRTRNLPEVCRQADIVVVAMGKMAAVGADCLRAGQTVVDVGIHVNEEGKLCGDVQFAAAEPVVDAITPVPGGVGTVTTSVLVGHVVQAACKKAGVEC